MDYPPVAIRLSFLIFSLLLIFTGCSSHGIEITFYEVNVVFDYQDESSFPTESLAVFLGFSSDVRRIEGMTVRCNENRELWTVGDPVIFGEGSSQWMGYSGLKAPDGEVIHNGSYTVKVTDSEGHQKEGAFMLDADERFRKLYSVQVKETFNENVRERIAVYSSDGELLFFDRPKEEWKNDDDLFWRTFKDAHHVRTVYSSGNTVCLMPVIYKSNNKQE